MEHPDLVCTLPLGQAPGQLAEWSELASAVLRRTELPDGVELVLPARLGGAAADLARREAACCGFLSLSVREDSDTVTLRITSDTPGADQVIAMLVGAGA